MPKRKKGCYNLECQRYRKEYMYDDTENFCSLCGSELVYVCVKCFSKIDEESTSHLCKKHEDEFLVKQQKRQKGVENVKGVAKNGAKAAVAVVPAAMKYWKDKDFREIADRAFKMVKKDK